MDYTEIVVAITRIAVFALCGLIARYIIPWLKQKGLYTFAGILVKTAYTTFESGEGQMKFDYVMEKLQAKFGKWVNTEDIVTAIQAAYVDFCIEKGADPSPAVETVKEVANAKSEK